MSAAELTGEAALTFGAEDGAHAGAAHEVDRNAGLTERLDDADVSEAARAAS